MFPFLFLILNPPPSSLLEVHLLRPYFGPAQMFVGRVSSLPKDLLDSQWVDRAEDRLARVGAVELDLHQPRLAGLAGMAGLAGLVGPSMEQP